MVDKRRGFLFCQGEDWIVGVVCSRGVEVLGCRHSWDLRVLGFFFGVWDFLIFWITFGYTYSKKWGSRLEFWDFGIWGRLVFMIFGFWDFRFFWDLRILKFFWVLWFFCDFLDYIRITLFPEVGFPFEFWDFAIWGRRVFRILGFWDFRYLGILGFYDFFGF